MAFNDPKLLDRERNELRAEMRSTPTVHGNKDLRAAGEALAARIESLGILDEPKVTHG